jgi:hypothetical protein
MNNDEGLDEIDAIDALINDVAREITSAPMHDAEGLARRVSARIDNDRAGRGTRTWRLAWLLPAAAACALAVLFVIRQPASVAPVTKVPAVQPAPAVTAGGQTGSVPPVAATVPRTAPTAATRMAASTPSPFAVQPAAARPASTTVEPLTLTPIVLAKVDVAALETAMPIELSAIAIERIDIPPMP